jgi:cytochrome c-type biogenesis protein CcmF
VRTSLGEDLYVTLLASDPDTGAVTLHLFVNPMVAWIWIGGAIIGVASAFAIWPERRRQPSVAREGAPAPAAAPAEGA